MRQGVLVDLDLRNAYFKTPLDYEKFVEEYSEGKEKWEVEKFLSH